MSVEWKISKKGVLKGCESDTEITELVIPDGVKAIDEHAFYGEEALTSIVIPESVTHIGINAFAECLNLEKISIPDSVTDIGAMAFDNTKWIKNQPGDFVIVNRMLLDYKGNAETVIIPEGVRHINELTASDTQEMKRLVIPEGVKSIGEYAFMDCKNLEEIHFPDSLKSIGRWAFMGCDALKRIRLPASLKEIDFEAFANCPLLERVPLTAVNRKIFYVFPGGRIGKNYADCMIRQKWYHMGIIAPEIRADLILQMYAYGMDTAGTEDYIRKQFPDMIPVLIRLNDVTFMQSILDGFPEQVQEHIDGLIQEAITQKKIQIQLMLTDYKYRHCSFQEKDWNL